MSTVIKAEGLSKKYIIGHQRQERYLTLRETMNQKFEEIGRRLLHPFLSSSGQPLTGLAITEDLWALKDVSFEISQGDRIGIIGRNGAGKTTLLKILSRITEPTEGRVSIKGRVASLLEVGTGFHPELTGRENIFLNGAVLGMSKAEIKKKFEEIVTFAELEKFLDTPVKRYSSGMYVRLAFAVAAHLEPEILLVDEVLAVGDAAFQKKCLGKMGSVAKEGRTVLFVSHNMTAIQQLCESALWISEGKLHLKGPSSLVVGHYLERTIYNSQGLLADRNVSSVRSIAYFTGIKLLNSDGKEAYVFPCGASITIEVRIKVKSGNIKGQCGLDFTTLSGVRVVNINSRILGRHPLNLTDGSVIRWQVAELQLTPGQYSINLRLKDANERDLLDFVENAAAFEVVGSDVYRTGHIISSQQGVTYLPISLEVS
ncbi:MAG: ATP-binding cassette domain-containing protein [Proteobacteria bacterium]|nr:ATP-binding cassette domain-containing protein [Pseudomonadota bacterium]